METTSIGRLPLHEISERLPTIPDEELVADLIRMDRTRRAVVFRLLPKDRAARVFDRLGPGIGSELVADLSDGPVREMFSELAPDDRTAILDEMPAGVANRILQELPEAHRADTMRLLGYPKESAGRRMSPLDLILRADATAAEALDTLRDRAAGGARITDAPVVDATRRYRGMIPLSSIVAADPGARLGDLVLDDTCVHTHDDQEDAANAVMDSPADLVPVVDAEGRLVGMLTEPDARAVLHLESDEDAALAGGSAPLRRPYLATSVIRLASKRIVWLLVLLVAASLTVGVLDAFEESLQSMVVLSLFIPLLIGTGGNTGAQAVTTVVRALSTHDVAFSDFFRVAFTELRTGLLLGTALGLCTFLPVTLFAGVEVALVLGISLVGICVLAATAGAVVPLLATKVGIDPAVVSAPFITTLVDASGLVLYFLVARAILGV